MYTACLRHRFFALIALMVVGLIAAPSPGFAQQPAGPELRDRLNRLERDLRTLNREVYRGALPGSSSTTAPRAPVASQAGRPPTQDGGSSAFASRVEQRISQMESDLRAVTGTMEKMIHDLSQVSQRLDKLVGDVDFRLSRLEAAPRPPATVGGAVPRQLPAQPQISGVPAAPGVQQVGPGSGGPVFSTGPRTLGTISGRDLSAVAAGTPGQPSANTRQSSNSISGAIAPNTVARAAPVAAPPAKPTLLPKGTPREQYNYSFSLLRQADYTKAAAAFQEFVETHPKDPLTPNAQYWLGETYYVRGAYAEAADIFLSGYQSTPKGQKAPDSLLKLGMSLIALDKKAEACATFDKLTADFPKAPSNVRRVLDRQRTRAACGTN